MGYYYPMGNSLSIPLLPRSDIYLSGNLLSDRGMKNADQIRVENTQKILNELFDGNQSRLAAALSEGQETIVTPSYVSRMLGAKKAIGPEMARRIEALAGKPANWLDHVHEESNVQPGPDIRGMVPLISWVKAGELCDTEDPLQPGDAERWIPCPESFGVGTFALRLSGDSMDDGTDEGYRDGEMIFVDPTVRADHNKDVVVRTGEGKATFKRLQITHEGSYLIALNPLYNKPIDVDEHTVICGVVIFSGKSR